MFLKNLIYAILIIVLVTILLTQVHQLGYIAGAMIQQKDIRIPSTLSTPDEFENWDTLSDFEKIVVYFSGYILIMIVWFIMVVLLPYSANALIIWSRIWSSIIILLYQLCAIIGIASIYFSENIQERIGFANLNYDKEPIYVILIVLTLLFITIIAIVRKHIFSNLLNTFINNELILYKEFNIIGSFLVSILALSIALTSFRITPPDIFSLEFVTNRKFEKIYNIENDNLEEDIYSFTLDKDQRVVINLLLEHIDSQYLALEIRSDSFEHTILNEDNIKIDERTIEAELKLGTGTYYINLTNFNNIINESRITLSLNIY